MKTTLLCLLASTTQSHLLRFTQNLPLEVRLTPHVKPTTSFLQLDVDRLLRDAKTQSLKQTDPAAASAAMDAAAVVGSNVGQYGVDDKLNDVRLVVEKNTGFALPVKSVDTKSPCNANPCEKELTPLEKKIKNAEAQVAALAKTRKIESETLESRIRREQEITDAAIEKQLTTQEQLSTDEQKLERLQHAVKEAELAAKKRKELLVDPNRFTDSCSPGFRIYFNGEAKDRMTYDDKKVLSKALKDRHCQDKDLLCICDMAKKQNVKSILGKVNAGVDCECYQGMSKEIREKEDDLHDAENEQMKQDAAKEEEAEQAEGSVATV